MQTTQTHKKIFHLFQREKTKTMLRQNGNLQESSHSRESPGCQPSVSLSPEWVTDYLCLPQEALQDPQAGLAHVLMGSLLCPWSLCTWNLVCSLLEWNLFPPVLWSPSTQAPLAFKAKLLWGLLLLMPDLQAGESEIGLSLLTPVREPLWYNYFLVCGLPTQRDGIFIISWKCSSYHLFVASALSLWVEYLFW